MSIVSWLNSRSRCHIKTTNPLTHPHSTFCYPQISPPCSEISTVPYTPCSASIVGEFMNPDGFVRTSVNEDVVRELAESFNLNKMLWGHWSEVHCLVVNEALDRFVSGADNCIVKVWCLSTGELIRSCIGHQNKIQDVVICPITGTIASSDQDGIVRLWTKDGLPIAVFNHLAGTPINKLLFVPPETSIELPNDLAASPFTTAATPRSPSLSTACPLIVLSEYSVLRYDLYAYEQAVVVARQQALEDVLHYARERLGTPALLALYNPPSASNSSSSSSSSSSATYSDASLSLLSTSTSTSASPSSSSMPSSSLPLACHTPLPTTPRTTLPTHDHSSATTASSSSSSAPLSPLALAASLVPPARAPSLVLQLLAEYVGETMLTQDLAPRGLTFEVDAVVDTLVEATGGRYSHDEWRTMASAALERAAACEGMDAARLEDYRARLCAPAYPSLPLPLPGPLLVIPPLYLSTFHNPLNPRPTPEDVRAVAALHRGITDRVDKDAAALERCQNRACEGVAEAVAPVLDSVHVLAGICADLLEPSGGTVVPGFFSENTHTLCTRAASGTDGRPTHTSSTSGGSLSGANIPLPGDTPVLAAYFSGPRCPFPTAPPKHPVPVGTMWAVLSPCGTELCLINEREHILILCAHTLQPLTTIHCPTQCVHHTYYVQERPQSPSAPARLLLVAVGKDGTVYVWARDTAASPRCVSRVNRTPYAMPTGLAACTSADLRYVQPDVLTQARARTALSCTLANSHEQLWQALRMGTRRPGDGLTATRCEAVAECLHGSVRYTLVATVTPRDALFADHAFLVRAAAASHIAQTLVPAVPATVAPATVPAALDALPAHSITDALWTASVAFRLALHACVMGFRVVSPAQYEATRAAPTPTSKRSRTTHMSQMPIVCTFGSGASEISVDVAAFHGCKGYLIDDIVDDGAPCHPSALRTLPTDHITTADSASLVGDPTDPSPLPPSTQPYLLSAVVRALAARLADPIVYVPLVLRSSLWQSLTKQDQQALRFRDLTSLEATHAYLTRLHGSSVSTQGHGHGHGVVDPDSDEDAVDVAHWRRTRGRATLDDDEDDEEVVHARTGRSSSRRRGGRTRVVAAGYDDDALWQGGDDSDYGVAWDAHDEPSLSTRSRSGRSTGRSRAHHAPAASVTRRHRSADDSDLIERDPDVWGDGRTPTHRLAYPFAVKAALDASARRLVVSYNRGHARVFSLDALWASLSARLSLPGEAAESVSTDTPTASGTTHALSWRVARLCPAQGLMTSLLLHAYIGVHGTDPLTVSPRGDAVLAACHAWPNLAPTRPRRIPVKVDPIAAATGAQPQQQLHRFEDAMGALPHASEVVMHPSLPLALTLDDHATAYLWELEPRGIAPAPPLDSADNVLAALFTSTANPGVIDADTDKVFLGSHLSYLRHFDDMASLTPHRVPNRESISGNRLLRMVSGRSTDVQHALATKERVEWMRTHSANQFIALSTRPLVQEALWSASGQYFLAADASGGIYVFGMGAGASVDNPDYASCPSQQVLDHESDDVYLNVFMDVLDRTTHTPAHMRGALLIHFDGKSYAHQPLTHRLNSFVYEPPHARFFDRVRGLVARCSRTPVILPAAVRRAHAPSTSDDSAAAAGGAAGSAPDGLVVCVDGHCTRMAVAHDTTALQLDFMPSAGSTASVAASHCHLHGSLVIPYTFSVSIAQPLGPAPGGRAHARALAAAAEVPMYMRAQARATVAPHAGVHMSGSVEASTLLPEVLLAGCVVVDAHTVLRTLLNSGHAVACSHLPSPTSVDELTAPSRPLPAALPRLPSVMTERRDPVGAEDAQVDTSYACIPLSTLAGDYGAGLGKDAAYGPPTAQTLVRALEDLVAASHASQREHSFAFFGTPHVYTVALQLGPSPGHSASALASTSDTLSSASVISSADHSRYAGDAVEERHKLDTPTSKIDSEVTDAASASLLAAVAVAEAEGDVALSVELHAQHMLRYLRAKATPTRQRPTTPAHTPRLPVLCSVPRRRCLRAALSRMSTSIRTTVRSLEWLSLANTLYNRMAAVQYARMLVGLAPPAFPCDGGDLYQREAHAQATRHARSFAQATTTLQGKRARDANVVGGSGGVSGDEAVRLLLSESAHLAPQEQLEFARVNIIAAVSGTDPTSESYDGPSGLGDWHPQPNDADDDGTCVSSTRVDTMSPTASALMVSSPPESAATDPFIAAVDAATRVRLTLCSTLSHELRITHTPLLVDDVPAASASSVAPLVQNVQDMLPAVDNSLLYEGEENVAATHVADIPLKEEAPMLAPASPTKTHITASPAQAGSSARLSSALIPRLQPTCTGNLPYPPLPTLTPAHVSVPPFDTGVEWLPSSLAHSKVDAPLFLPVAPDEAMFYESTLQTDPSISSDGSSSALAPLMPVDKCLFGDELMSYASALAVRVAAEAAVAEAPPPFTTPTHMNASAASGSVDAHTLHKHNMRALFAALRDAQTYQASEQMSTPPISSVALGAVFAASLLRHGAKCLPAPSTAHDSALPLSLPISATSSASLTDSAMSSSAPPADTSAFPTTAAAFPPDSVQAFRSAVASHHSNPLLALQQEHQRVDSHESWRRVQGDLLAGALAPLKLISAAKHFAHVLPGYVHALALPSARQWPLCSRDSADHASHEAVSVGSTHASPDNTASAAVDASTTSMADLSSSFYLATPSSVSPRPLSVPVLDAARSSALLLPFSAEYAQHILAITKSRASGRFPSALPLLRHTLGHADALSLAEMMIARHNARQLEVAVLELLAHTHACARDEMAFPRYPAAGAVDIEEDSAALTAMEVFDRRAQEVRLQLFAANALCPENGHELSALLEELIEHHDSTLMHARVNLPRAVHMRSIVRAYNIVQRYRRGLPLHGLSTLFADALALQRTRPSLYLSSVLAAALSLPTGSLQTLPPVTLAAVYAFARVLFAGYAFLATTPASDDAVAVYLRALLSSLTRAGVSLQSLRELTRASSTSALHRCLKSLTDVCLRGDHSASAASSQPSSPTLWTQLRQLFPCAVLPGTTSSLPALSPPTVLSPAASLGAWARPLSMVASPPASLPPAAPTTSASAPASSSAVASSTSPECTLISTPSLELVMTMQSCLDAARRSLLLPSSADIPRSAIVAPPPTYFAAIHTLLHALPMRELPLWSSDAAARVADDATSAALDELKLLPFASAYKLQLRATVQTSAKTVSRDRRRRVIMDDDDEVDAMALSQAPSTASSSTSSLPLPPLLTPPARPPILIPSGEVPAFYLRHAGSDWFRSTLSDTLPVYTGAVGLDAELFGMATSLNELMFLSDNITLQGILDANISDQPPRQRVRARAAEPPAPLAAAAPPSPPATRSSRLLEESSSSEDEDVDADGDVYSHATALVYTDMSRRTRQSRSRRFFDDDAEEETRARRGRHSARHTRSAYRTGVDTRSHGELYTNMYASSRRGPPTRATRSTAPLPYADEDGAELAPAPAPALRRGRGRPRTPRTTEEVAAAVDGTSAEDMTDETATTHAAAGTESPSEDSGRRHRDAHPAKRRRVARKNEDEDEAYSEEAESSESDSEAELASYASEESELEQSRSSARVRAHARGSTRKRKRSGRHAVPARRSRRSQRRQRRHAYEEEDDDDDDDEEEEEEFSDGSSPPRRRSTATNTSSSSSSSASARAGAVEQADMAEDADSMLTFDPAAVPADVLYRSSKLCARLQSEASRFATPPWYAQSLPLLGAVLPQPGLSVLFSCDSYRDVAQQDHFLRALYAYAPNNDTVRRVREQLLPDAALQALTPAGSGGVCVEAVTVHLPEGPCLLHADDTVSDTIFVTVAAHRAALRDYPTRYDVHTDVLPYESGADAALSSASSETGGDIVTSVGSVEATSPAAVTPPGAVNITSRLTTLAADSASTAEASSATGEDAGDAGAMDDEATLLPAMSVEDLVASASLLSTDESLYRSRIQRKASFGVRFTLEEAVLVEVALDEGVLTTPMQLTTHTSSSTSSAAQPSSARIPARGMNRRGTQRVSYVQDSDSDADGTSEDDAGDDDGFAHSSDGGGSAARGSARRRSTRTVAASRHSNTTAPPLSSRSQRSTRARAAPDRRDDVDVYADHSRVSAPTCDTMAASSSRTLRTRATPTTHEGAPVRRSARATAVESTVSGTNRRSRTTSFLLNASSEDEEEEDEEGEEEEVVAASIRAPTRAPPAPRRGRSATNALLNVNTDSAGATAGVGEAEEDGSAPEDDEYYSYADHHQLPFLTSLRMRTGLKRLSAGVESELSSRDARSAAEAASVALGGATGKVTIQSCALTIPAPPPYVLLLPLQPCCVVAVQPGLVVVVERGKNKGKRSVTILKVTLRTLPTNTESGRHPSQPPLVHVPVSFSVFFSPRWDYLIPAYRAQTLWDSLVRTPALPFDTRLHLPIRAGSDAVMVEVRAVDSTLPDIAAQSHQAHAAQVPHGNVHVSTNNTALTPIADAAAPTTAPDMPLMVPVGSYVVMRFEDSDAYFVGRVVAVDVDSTRSLRVCPHSLHRVDTDADATLTGTSAGVDGANDEPLLASAYSRRMRMHRSPGLYESLVVCWDLSLDTDALIAAFRDRAETDKHTRIHNRFVALTARRDTLSSLRNDPAFAARATAELPLGYDLARARAVVKALLARTPRAYVKPRHYDPRLAALIDAAESSLQSVSPWEPEMVLLPDATGAFAVPATDSESDVVETAVDALRVLCRRDGVTACELARLMPLLPVTVAYTRERHATAMAHPPSTMPVVTMPVTSASSSSSSSAMPSTLALAEPAPFPVIHVSRMRFECELPVQMYDPQLRSASLANVGPNGSEVVSEETPVAVLTAVTKAAGETHVGNARDTSVHMNSFFFLLTRLFTTQYDDIATLAQQLGLSSSTPASPRLAFDHTLFAFISHPADASLPARLHAVAVQALIAHEYTVLDTRYYTFHARQRIACTHELLPQNARMHAIVTATPQGTPVLSVPLPSVMSPLMRMVCLAALLRPSLIAQEDFFPFLFPVPADFTDYTARVAMPVDVTLLARRLMLDFYPSIDAFFVDLELIYANSVVYNGADSPVTHAALTLALSVRSVIVRVIACLLLDGGAADLDAHVDTLLWTPHRDTTHPASQAHTSTSPAHSSVQQLFHIEASAREDRLRDVLSTLPCLQRVGGVCADVATVMFAVESSVLRGQRWYETYIDEGQRVQCCTEQLNVNAMIALTNIIRQRTGL